MHFVCFSTMADKVLEKITVCTLVVALSAGRHLNKSVVSVRECTEIYKVTLLYCYSLLFFVAKHNAEFMKANNANSAHKTVKAFLISWVVWPTMPGLDTRLYDSISYNMLLLMLSNSCSVLVHQNWQHWMSDILRRTICIITTCIKLPLYHCLLYYDWYYVRYGL